MSVINYVIGLFVVSVLYICWIEFDTYSLTLYERYRKYSVKYDRTLLLLCRRYASQFSFWEHYSYIYLGHKSKWIHVFTVVAVNTLLYALFIMQVNISMGN